MTDESRESGPSHESGRPQESPPRRPGGRRGPLAVALRDERAGPGAPRILAKGQGKVAEQILEIAFARGIKVRTDASLAEVLAAIDVDSEIPVQALAAVAEILTHVYRANGAAPSPGEAERGAAAADPEAPDAGTPQGGEAP